MPERAQSIIADIKADNVRDHRGWPLCPICRRPVLPDDGFTRDHGYLMHAECWTTAK